MEVYLVQQPKDLDEMAIEALGEWIASRGVLISETHLHDATKADAKIDQQINITRNYLHRGLPNIYQEKLAAALAESLNRLERSAELKLSQKMVAGRMIETIFTEHLTQLSLCSEILFASIFSKTYTTLTGLVDLAFNPSSLSGDMEENSIRFLKELPNLRRLDLSYCSGITCIDKILKCIAENCKLIEDLNLSNIECVTDDSIDILITLKKLKRIELAETAVSDKSIEKFLLSCDDIEYVMTDDADMNLALALERIASDEEHTEKRFKLTSFELYRYLSIEDLQLVVKMCPLIQKVVFVKFDLTGSYLTALQDLQQLRELKLYSYHFYEDNVKGFLRVRGEKIVVLELENVEHIDLDALTCISQMCPRLESLTLDNCGFEEQRTQSGLFLSKKPVKMPFANLKRICLEASAGGFSRPSAEQLVSLLSSCPNLEFISSNFIPLTDDILLKVLDNNQLSCLEKMKLTYQKRPSSLVIDRIVQNCVNISEVTISECQ